MQTAVIDSTGSTIPTDSVTAVDGLIESVRLTPTSNTESYHPAIAPMAKALLTLQEGSVLAPAKDPIESLFDGHLSVKVQRLAAICFIRLLAINFNCITPDCRQKVFTLCDDSLKDVYSITGMTAKAQTYEKFRTLSAQLEQAEANMSETFHSLGDLSTLANFREKFMRQLNHSTSKTFIQPFLSKELLDARLREVFEVVEDYVGQSGAKLLPAYERAQQTLSGYERQAIAAGTTYAAAYLTELAVRLNELVTTHFAATSLSKPGFISVEASKKKYPLQSEGQNFHLSFTVSNVGPGIAFATSVRLESDVLELERTETYLGDLDVSTYFIEVTAKVSSPTGKTDILLECRWENFDKTEGREDYLLQIEAQRSGIDWRTLQTKRPYSLEPVTTEAELVGRQDVLNELRSFVEQDQISSAYILGQKRVGKTSLVKTLDTEIRKSQPDTFKVVYLEAGDYVAADAKATVERLGMCLCQGLKYQDRRFAHIPIPSFDGALSPLVDFLNELSHIAPDTKVLFILDEFDELPLELYKLGPLGGAIFLTLRSVSAKERFGFLLVGSETMRFIIQCQGSALNKFSQVKLDYLNKENHWTDFQELVRRPVEGWLDIDDEALVCLYETSAGNPFFTKLICREIFRLMVQRRDCHVVRREVEEAIKIAADIAPVTNFQHFWEDGIFETGAKREEVSMDRRRVLLALTDVLRRGEAATSERVFDMARRYELPSVVADTILKDFLVREVLVNDGPGETYRFKVPFVERWLKEKGIGEIFTTFSDADAVAARQRAEEAAYVRADEIVNLTKAWPPYKGRQITEDTVRAWLNQFGDNADQRLMFRVLQGLRFFSNDFLRAKMGEAHKIVGRGSVVRLAKGTRLLKTSELLVSYLDNVGKSGAYYAKLYADENKVYHKNIIERSRIVPTLNQDENIKAIVFIDDFLGSGNSVVEGLKTLAEEVGKPARRGEVKLFFVAICGFQEALAKVDLAAKEMELPLETRLCEPFDSSAKVFSDASFIFPDVADREKAYGIAYLQGKKLVKDNPLGYGDCQSAVVFENNCPNNDLPILWKEDKDWTPLFKRL